MGKGQVTVTMPERLKERADEQVQKRGYASRAEFIREAAREKLRQGDR